MSLRMTKAEREAFLADVHVGIVCVAEEGRGPLAVPIWYAYEPGGDVFFGTAADSPKAQLMRAAGRASLVAQTETPPYRYVSVEGPVAVHSGPTPEPPMAIRYLGEEQGRRYTEQQAGAGGGVTFRLTPERWLTVDYAKR